MSLDVERLWGCIADMPGRGGSDLHFVSGQPAMIRIDGRLQPLDTGLVSAAAVTALIEATTDADQQAQLAAHQHLDYALDAAAGPRLRAHAYQANTGPALALRLIRDDIPSLAALGAPPVLEQVLHQKQGLILVTGPTGSGKSTTLAAMVDHINRHQGGHILTIEDPIEVRHESRHALVTQRQLGRDSGTYAAALRGALRADPDVLLIGEMRDHTTMALALTAAETGHLVLSTLHTATASRRIRRIVDGFPSGERGLVRSQLAGSLSAVVAQTLLPKIGGGRVAAYEVMLATPAIRNMIREDQLHQIDSMIQIGAKLGMTHFRDEIGRLLSQGVIDPADARAALAMVSDDPDKAARDFGARAGIGP